MSKLTKRTVERFNDGDLTEPEFYRLKGVIAVFEQASKEEIFNAQHADCEDCFIAAIAQMVKYVMDDEK